MTISSTNLVDDNFKVINKITGARNENEKLIELDITKKFDKCEKNKKSNLRTMFGLMAFNVVISVAMLAEAIVVSEDE